MAFLLVLLTNGDTIRFRGGLTGFKGAPSAFVLREKRELVSHVAITVEGQEPILLYPKVK